MKPALAKKFDIAIPDSADAYRIELRTRIDSPVLVGMIEASYSDLFAVFGPGKHTENALVSNEWTFFSPRAGRFFSVIDGIVPSETAEGPYAFEIYMEPRSNHVEGQAFARWLADRIYARRITKDFTFLA